MIHLLNKLLAHEILSKEEAASVIYALHEENFNPYQLTAIMTALQLRSPHIEELKGFQEALIALAIEVPIHPNEGIDLCGTGGDGKGTFNISTSTALVLAAIGEKVKKHGNFGVSSTCGSSDVIQALGFELTNDIKSLEKHYKEKGIMFLHAPLFHPVLAKAAPIRKALGVRTFFNSLGPLLNPAYPAHQVSGTYSLELAQLYPYLLGGHRKRCFVLHGQHGYDELTLADRTTMYGSKQGVLSPQLFDLPFLAESELRGEASPELAAQRIRGVLKGNGKESDNQVIAANVVLALDCIYDNVDYPSTTKEVLRFIESGKAAKHYGLN
jgi:anthranilate phosphoribosyltransferase